MKTRFYFLFPFFTLLFLFYPGNSALFDTFAYHRNLFIPTKTLSRKIIQPFPVVRNQISPVIQAQGAYIVDLSSFTPIYEKNIHEKFLPASLAKIMTALVAYDIYKPDEIIEVKRTFSDGQSENLQLMGLFQGEKISVENLLYGILIHSGNDAAYALADHVGFDKFIKLMNQKANVLHMSSSHFKNPAGLDDMDQYTSPFDLSLAARALLTNNYLAKIVSIKEITIADSDYKYFHHLVNVNKLLGEVQGVGGLKTGYTENAGENLVSFYKNNNHQSIIVVLKSTDRFADTKNIISWINENVSYSK